MADTSTNNSAETFGSGALSTTTGTVSPLMVVANCSGACGDSGCGCENPIHGDP